MPYVVLSLIAVLASGAADECPCNPQSPLVAYETSDFVLSGQVLGAVGRVQKNGVVQKSGEYRPLSFFSLTKWSILVENSWKGVEGDTVFVYSVHPTSCGYEFEPGERYLIYGNYNDTGRLARYAWPPGQPARILVTGVCHRTCRLAEASEDLAQLPEPVALAE